MRAVLSDENAKVPGKNRNSYRARNKRGRTRASKDTSKLLLLYDDEILERDPLREQKDLAFAQAYLKRVRKNRLTVDLWPQTECESLIFLILIEIQFLTFLVTIS